MGEGLIAILKPGSIFLRVIAGSFQVAEFDEVAVWPVPGERQRLQNVEFRKGGTPERLDKQCEEKKTQAGIWGIATAELRCSRDGDGGSLSAALCIQHVSDKRIGIYFFNTRGVSLPQLSCFYPRSSSQPGAPSGRIIDSCIPL